MSGPVDALAVLAEYWRRHDLPEDLLLARLAIEELIAADKAYDAATAALEEYYRQGAEKGHRVARLFNVSELSAAFERADTRRQLAQLRIGGAQ